MRDLLQEYSTIIYEPAVKVYCNTCGTHIYNMDKVPLGNTLLSASLFKPARKDIPYPEAKGKAKCPICGGEFLGPEGELLVGEL